MSNPDGFFVLRRKSNPEVEWPVYGTTEGGRATFMFKSRALAQRFADGKKLVDWEPHEFPKSQFKQWLEDNRLGGVTHIMPDPDPNAATPRYVPVETLIVAADLES